MKGNSNCFKENPKIYLRSIIRDHYNPAFKKIIAIAIMIKDVTTMMVMNFLSEKLFIVIKFSEHEVN